MTCLYATDYGEPDPAFDPLMNGGRLLWGLEAHVPELSTAQNLGQLEAMERQLQRGESIAWCNEGYSWVEGWAVDGFLTGFTVLVVLPYAVKRLTPRLWCWALEAPQRRAATPGTDAERTNRTAYPGEL
jgi:hypothetical protein